jgi:hypothetical protein
MAPAATAATPPPLLTTVMVPYAAGQSIQQSTVGVIISYNSTYTSSLPTFVHMSLLNGAGQTVTLESTGAVFSANASLTFFFGLTGFQPGNYTAQLFATTTTGVAISGVNAVNLTIS